ncbi:hypothetical protein [Cecembia sp.]|uniref:hypothetical protein n=1 Tax=Cecembia sp. TaxID=1898110 RepID=UPI0025C0037A|nr:hypothetical protein [Cecembia sp.]
MTKDDLKRFIKPYQKHVQKGLPAIDKCGHLVTEQSQWVFFDRETIQKLLDMTDPSTGGIKIYFGQYSRENIYLIPEDRLDKEEYIGKISVALSAANEDKDGIFDLFAQESKHKSSGDESVQNAGKLCPPHCRPPDSI